MQMLNMLAVTDGAAAAGIGGFAMVLIAVGILLSVFWVWMLIDCLTSGLPATEKLIWFLVIFFLHILGAVLYYAVARTGGRRTGIA